MENVSSARIALKWGLISALIGITYNTISYNTGLWENTAIGVIVGFVITFGALYFAMNEFKSLSGGFMTFNQGLGLGMLLSATSGILGLGFDMVYKKYVDPDIFAQQLEKSREQMESYGLSEEQVEQSIASAEKYNSSGMAFILGILVVLFFGLICSLIMSAILKKNKPVFD